MAGEVECACDSPLTKSCRRPFDDVVTIEPTAAVFDAIDDGADHFDAGQLQSLVRLINLIDPAVVPQHGENGAIDMGAQQGARRPP